MDSKENITESTSIESTDKKRNPKSRSYKSKEDFKEKECEVINYNKHFKTLDIRFDNYGIRIKNVEHFNETNTVIIKYKGEIGKPNFTVELR